MTTKGTQFLFLLTDARAEFTGLTLSFVYAGYLLGKTTHPRRIKYGQFIGPKSHTIVDMLP
jgi:hypothetical protein